MRVILSNNGQKIGYLDFEIINFFDKLGQLGAVMTQPPQLAELIRTKIMTNAYGVVVAGGDTPPDLSLYWDGVYATLLRIKAEVSSFDFVVPTEEDPLQYPEGHVPESLKGRVY